MKRKIDTTKLNFSDEFIFMRDALKDAASLEIPDDVTSGKKIMQIEKPSFDYDNKGMGATAKIM